MKPNETFTNVTINEQDQLINLNIEGLEGKVAVWNCEDFICGYTLGKNLPTFHASEDPNLDRAKSALKQVGVADFAHTIKIYPEHGDKILLNNSDSPSDGIIITDGRPLILTPADCCGFIFINPKSGVYGIFHAGRAGVGLNVAAKFSNKFKEVVEEKQGDINETIIFLPPHIFGFEYPHNSNAFMFNEDGTLNWWGSHTEFLNKSNNHYYPDIGPASVSQIQEALGYRVKIILSGLSTFQGHGYSHSVLKNKMRNLVFVGKSLKS